MTKFSLGCTVAVRQICHESVPVKRRHREQGTCDRSTLTQNHCILMVDEFNSSTDLVLIRMKYLFLLVQLNKSLAVGALKIITLGSDVQM